MYGKVSLPEMLAAREERAARQRALLQKNRTLVCLTLNIPGPQKVTPLIKQAFFAGLRLTERALAPLVPWERARIIREKTGLEAYYLCDIPAAAVKRALCAVEDETAVGRVFDLDVLSVNGEKLSREELGLPPRRCLLCGQPAFVCARSRSHSIADMMAEIERRIMGYRAAECAHIGALAVDALAREARTTPKPGLVDERNQGAHPDMTLEMLLQSARSLAGYFAACAEAGAKAEETDDLFPTLQALGREAEQAMLRVTHGVNTHKGAVFSLGLLCAAAGRCFFHAPDFTPDALCKAAGEICAPAMAAYFAALRPENARTFGDKLYLTSGIRGIRGEAAAGFPALTGIALPEMRARLAAGYDENEAGVYTLLSLLTRIDDTTLLKRGGVSGAAFARESAGTLINGEKDLQAVEALDDAFIARGLTCGGCADLLACAYFLLSQAA